MKVYDASGTQGRAGDVSGDGCAFQRVSRHEILLCRFHLKIAPVAVSVSRHVPVKDKRQVGRKAINMAPQPPLREKETANWEFFLSLPEVPSAHLNVGRHQELTALAAALRVFRCMFRLWRNTLYQAG